MDDDSDKKSENLPPEEPSGERGDAEKSPSSPLSQHSSTQNLVIEDNDDLPVTAHSLSPKSLEELKRKLKKQIFGDDYYSADLETSGDKQDKAAVSAEEASSPERSASTVLEELKLKLKRDLFGEDYDSHDYDTTDDDDSTSTTITSEATLTSVHGSNFRETTPSSSVAKQPEDTLPEKIMLAETAAADVAKETKPLSTDAAPPTSPAEQAGK